MDLFDNLVSFNNGSVFFSKIYIVVREYVSRESLNHAVILVHIYSYETIQIK
jgi:hypothetical protein